VKKIMSASYAHPEVLVDTDWVASHAKDDNVRVVEVDVDNKAYDEGHVPGSMAWAWNTQLCDTVVRDILPKAAFEALMMQSGIGNDTTVVLYGDNNNWFAAWAFWQMKIYGHKDVRIMDGGRKKWLAECRDLDTVATKPAAGATGYRATEPDSSLRAFLPQVQQAQKSASAVMIDVRSPQEFSGEILAPPGLPETCQRGGHIPGARSVPWGKACNDDGTFKPAGELEKLYGAEGVARSKPVIAYCRIGERSSHTWFVLKYLLGISNVMNYDGSWTEWGNLVGAPVERGAAKAVGQA
jgi:thiosulfate/3-mercaptopyruvate sulfurtransferase